MFLKHEKMANQKLAIAGGVIECDAEGICEVKDDAVAQSLIVSGFTVSSVKSPLEAKPATKKSEPKIEVKTEAKAEEPVVPVKKWQRSK